MKILSIIMYIWIGLQLEGSVFTTKKYFDLPKFTKKIIRNQMLTNSKVVKTTKVNGTEEVTNINNTDSAFWVRELLVLLKTDINKPSLLDAYSIKNNINLGINSLKKTTYTALPETKSTIKLLALEYDEVPKEIRYVIIKTESENPVYTSQQKIQLWVNKYSEKLLLDSLLIEGFNKTILLDSIKYSSKLVVINPS